MRILIVDCTIDPDSWGSADLRRLARLASGAEIHVRRAPQEDLPRDLSLYDHVIVSGSRTAALDDAPWIDRLHELIRGAVERSKPFLGVCYGHQSLVRAFGGKTMVRRGERPELGWARIEIVEPSDLLRGLPETFYSFERHFDEVSALPERFTKLARSEACDIQAVQVKGLPVFGIQFHPEKDTLGAERTFEELARARGPRPLLHRKEGGKLYDPKVGETIFRNFLGLGSGAENAR